MAIPRVRTIIREDVPGAPDWIESLLTLLNRGFTDISGVLEHGLTATDNLLAEVKNITVTMPATFPNWHNVGTTGEPPFQNGFTQWPTSGGVSNVGFRMWPDGVVELRGLVKVPATAPSGFTTIFTLPSGYLPANHQRIIVSQQGVGRSLEIPRDGTVQVGGASAWVANEWASFDDIRFQAGDKAAKADLFAKPFPIAVATSGRFPIKQCTAMRVVDKTDKARGVLGPTHIDWEPNGTGLTINAIWGLQPGRTYGIDLLMSAG